MRKISVGIAILISIFLTIPLVSILYFGKVAFGLPFVVEDLYGWLVRAGVGPFDALYSGLANRLTADGRTPAQVGELASLLLSAALFLIIGTLLGLLFYLLAGRKTFALDWVDGVAIGSLFGTPLIFISLNSGASPINPVIQTVWLAVLFIAWGVALALVYRRLGKIDAEAAPTGPLVPPSEEIGEGESESATDAEVPTSVVSEVSGEPIGRRQFLLRLGASTAAITAISGLAAVTLDNPERAAAQRQTLPVASAETVAFYNRTFRRFSIVRLQPGAAEGELTVLALGAEYPDHHYVTLWIGEQSPIVVYENIETALAAYRSARDSESIVEVVWLDH
jgi:hypothetical protein